MNTSEHGSPRNDAGVRSVHVTLDIIELLAGSEGEMGVTEIAQALGLGKPAVFRHLVTLTERGFLAQNPTTSRYHWGPRLYVLGRNAPERFDLASLAASAMRDLGEATGQTVVLSAPGPNGIVVLSTLKSAQQIEIGVREGSSLALNASAQGKVALAFGPSELRERLETTGYVRFTEYTLIEPAALDAELSRIRQRGWAVAPNEVLLGINTLAMPIMGPGARLVGALAIVGSVQFVAPSPEPRVLDALRAAVHAIEAVLQAASPVSARPARARKATKEAAR